MSTDLTCFLIGLLITGLWLIGLRSGAMVGHGWYLGWPRQRVVRRVDRPVVFWIQATLIGTICLAFLVMPVLSWLHLRA